MGKHRWPTAGDPWEPPVHALDPPPPVARPGGHPSAPDRGLGWGGLREDDDRRGDDTEADITVGQPGADEARSGAGLDDGRETVDEDGYAPRRGPAPGRAGAFAAWAEPDEGAPPSVHRGVQWRVARSAALVFLGVALAVGAALFLTRSSDPSAAAVSVQLDAGGADGGAPAEGDGERNGDGDDEPPREEPGGGSGADGGTTDGDGVGPQGGADSGTAPGAAEPGDAPPGHLPAGGPGRGAGGEVIVVYVTGAVVSPGVVTVPAGTRLFEIIEDVGGALPEADLEGINLAATPADGQHIHLLAVGEEPRPDQVDVEGPAPGGTAAGGTAGGTDSSGGAAGPTGGSGSPAGVLDINTATLADIESLPRVGPILAQRIIDWRDEHGPFAQPADIDAVPGIGPAILEGILPLIDAR
ncbi:ComEA family DNA-binding protein [Arthrobacter sp. B0490]|uniref:ComEA family DNA-binding protein n=1 Tax=Arthrobacter sp. B0490 TaxID=2058891 RepID=UPI000CE50E1D|nr:ComEA family DNA-binding protein [Arthrobacter sp. B0490]